MEQLKLDELRAVFEGKSVAIVGSGPGCLDNEEGYIDSHDVVVRINNFKLTPETGWKTDVFYSFFGNSVRKTARDLQRNGVKYCMCKCPNGKFIDSPWHNARGLKWGTDFRYIYARRAHFWFCPTWVPSVEWFLENFNALGRHIPTTGMAAIMDIVRLDPDRIYLTGFDFFSSGIHNVNEPWRSKNKGDPIGHSPKHEKAWIAKKAYEWPHFEFDEWLNENLQLQKQEIS